MENEETKVEETVEQVDNKSVIADIRAAFADDAEFALDAIERGLSVLEAKAEYCEKLMKQNADLAEELAELQASVNDQEADVDGEIPVEFIPEQAAQFEADTPEAEMEALIVSAMKEHSMERGEATRFAFRENKELADKLI